MQKLFQNKSITQKIIIAIVFVILFNFTCPCIVQAENYNFIVDALAWLIVRVTDCAQWIMLFCLTGDVTAVSAGGSNDGAIWRGKDDRIDEWMFVTTGLIGSGVNAIKHYTGVGNLRLEWPKRHILAPDDIFTGNILITNINFFTSYKDKKSTITDSNKTWLGDALTFLGDKAGIQKDESENLEKLRIAIAKWYVTIRNITIVGLLSVLVYVAIRMVISTAAQDKSKYQKMLTDWLVSLCLVFTLHYIMAVTIGVCENLTNVLNKTLNSGIYMDDGDKFEYNGKFYGGKDDPENQPLDNLTMKIRIYTRTANSNEAVSYSLMYLAITIWTAIYFVIYMKRFVFMAFYTLMAPIVALTYPIDKIGDGRSQAFDGWLKEYIYTALKQPFHLLLYTVFIGMAKEIANSNFIYTFVVLWAMVQLDGTLAKWIGVDAASSTGSSIKEGAQSLLALKGITSLVKGNSSGGSSAGGTGGSGTSGSTNTKPRIKGTSALGGNATPTPPIRQTNQQQGQQPGQQTAQQPAQQTANPQGGNSGGNTQTAQNNANVINPGLAGYQGTKPSKHGNKTLKKEKRKNGVKAKIINPVASSRLSQYAGKHLRPAANLAGKIAKTAVVGTATVAGLMTGGIQGAASFKGIAEDATGTVEKYANKVKNKASNYLNDHKNDYTQQLDRMSMATKEEKETMDKEYDGYGGRNSRAAAKMADLSGFDVVNDPKTIKQSLDISNQIMQSDPRIGADDAMAITAEAHKYDSYSRKDDATVSKLIAESGTPYSSEVFEAWKCLQDFTGQRKYNLTP